MFTPVKLLLYSLTILFFLSLVTIQVSFLSNDIEVPMSEELLDINSTALHFPLEGHSSETGGECCDIAEDLEVAITQFYADIVSHIDNLSPLPDRRLDYKSPFLEQELRPPQA